MNDKNTSIVPQANVPSSIGELETIWKIAEKACKSGLTKVDNVFDAFFLIGYGGELGITPFSSLRTIYSVNGVPTCSGEMMLGLIRRSGLLESNKIEELTDKSGNYLGSVCTMKRKDTSEEISISFTMKDAQTAGLAGKAVWKQYPKNMCRWRAVSNVAKLLFGDVIGGLYTFEELAHDDQQIDETGAPVGEVLQVKKVQTNDVPEQSTPTADEPDPHQEQKPSTEDVEKSTTWLQIPANKQWLIETLNNNGLTPQFFKSINPESTGWGDIANQYKNRKLLEKAIFEAMGPAEIIEDIKKNEDGGELYDNEFDADLIPDKWGKGAYEALTSVVEQYFDDKADDLIKGGLGVEKPEKEYSSPRELWDEVVKFAIDTNVSLLCNQFNYIKGKQSYISTYHPVLAICYSRSKFIKMIGEDQFCDKAGIKDWEPDGNPHMLHRKLVISFESKVHNSGKTYQTITGATLQSISNDNLDELFD